MAKIHDLKPAEGSKKARRRVARGTAGRRGKTAGRGMKGQKARSTVPVGFEGGQTPLFRRTPKLKGFRNPFRVEYNPVNLDVLDRFEDGAEVTPESLRARGLTPKRGNVKILGRGELTKKLTVRAHKFSKTAREAIEAAGGSVEELPPPFKGPRPPASGNALSNR